MTRLRYLEKADGEKVLQIRVVSLQNGVYSDDWEDVGVVKEPRKAREFLIKFSLDWDSVYHGEYHGGPVPLDCLIVREVLEP